jgi:hypothetical protein
VSHDSATLDASVYTVIPARYRPSPAWAEQMAVSLSEAALRVERVAQDLNDASRE